MIKKVLCLLLCGVIITVFAGCSDSKQIDKAALVETVSVTQSGNHTVYTFYILDSSSNVNSVNIVADSFENACQKAKKDYIPELTLSKFELFIINEKLCTELLAKDVEFIASQYSICPLTYVVLAEDEALNYVNNTKEAPKQVEDHILLLKNKEKHVSVNSLSIFNNIALDNSSKFCMCCINSKNELNAEIREISVKK